MKAKWLGETEFLYLTHGKVYEVLSIEYGLYRVVDDSGEDYLYGADSFEVIEGSEEDLRKEGKILEGADDESQLRLMFLLLTEAELSFLAEECSADKNWLKSAKEEDLLDLYDKVGFIEADETAEAGDSPLSMRGEVASSIVTKIGELFRVFEPGIDDD